MSLSEEYMNAVDQIHRDHIAALDKLHEGHLERRLKIDRDYYRMLIAMTVVLGLFACSFVWGATRDYKDRMWRGLAVQYGAAEWVVDQEGVASFKWKNQELGK